MSSRRRTLQYCVCFLVGVALLQVVFFRVQPLLLDRFEDSRATTTLTIKQHQREWATAQGTTTTTPIQSPQIILPIQQQDAIITSSSSSSPPVIIPTARLNKCLVETNRIHIYDKTQEHRNQGLPLFASIVQSPIRMDERRPRQRHDDYDKQEQGQENDDDDLYWTAHFTLVHLTWKRKHNAPRIRFPQWSYPQKDHGDGANFWYCDNQPAMVVNDGCPKGNSLNIRCPQKNHEVVSNITIYNYTYYVRDHVICELYHSVNKPLQPLLPSPSTATTTIASAQGGGVAAAVMVYKMNVQLALEWMEYHRLIGIDHFFIYVLDTDTEFVEQQWPDLDYMTYIPWNLNPQTERSNVDLFLFQTAAQINAILRARAVPDLQWIAMNDMDEYIVTRGNYMASTTTTSATMGSAPAPAPLKTLLANYYHDDSNDDNNNNNNVVAAIQGETISFGKQNGNNKTRLPFLLDYSWRNDRTYGKEKRTKCIVRPSLVEYYVIHWVSWPIPSTKHDNIHKADAEQELWIHHYKKPQNGPFTSDLKDVTKVEDTFLRDMYASVVSERVHDILARIQE